MLKKCVKLYTKNRGSSNCKHKDSKVHGVKNLKISIGLLTLNNQIAAVLKRDFSSISLIEEIISDFIMVI